MAEWFRGAVLTDDCIVEGLRIERDIPGIGRRLFALHLSRLPGKAGKVQKTFRSMETGS